jgi:serine/threonine protein kinase
MSSGLRPSPINTGDPPGQRAARFSPEASSEPEVLQELGTGKSSVVHLVVFQNKRCARKKVHGVRSSAQDISDCVNEFALMGTLRHPNIVRIFTANFAHGTLNLYMEYVAGASLADRYSRSRKVPERVLGRIAWLCLEALGYLRSTYILHRDLKPSNILISDAGEVKLCDFGSSARLEASSDARLTDAGSVKYMSLERLKGLPYNFPADIWSLGILIYEGAAGRYPIDDALVNIWGLRETFERGLDYKLEGYSDEFKGFLRQCLAQAPEARLPVENRRSSWAGRFENDGQDDLMEWVRATGKPSEN